MARYTEVQKRIALLLLYEAKTVEQLQKQLNLSYDEVMTELKGLLKLKVVEKEGYPTVYRLIPTVADAVKKRKKMAETDPFKLRLKAIIEAQSADQELLKEQLERITGNLKNDTKKFNVYDVMQAKSQTNDEGVSSAFIEVTLSVKNFRTLVYFMFFYAPSSIEVIKPERFDISLPDLQDGLHDMSDMINAYSMHILRLMSRKELNEFNNKLFGVGL
ncbi:MAG: hypothetical protein ABH821_02975 [archaeon]